MKTILIFTTLFFICSGALLAESNIATPTTTTIKAASATGLSLEDDGANVGVFVEDGGQVGIGVITPSSTLEVSSPGTTRLTVDTTNVGATTGVILQRNATNTWEFRNNSSGDILEIVDVGATHGVTLAQNATSWGAFSDRRLKENIEPLSYGLKDILKLNPKKYSWIKTGTKDFGLIAQDVKVVFPDIVTGGDNFIEGDISTAMSIQYTKLIPVLIESIKELNNRIEQLEAKLNM